MIARGSYSILSGLKTEFYSLISRSGTGALNPTTSSSRQVQRGSLRESLEPLWVSGLVLLILHAATLLRLEGESFDWTEYLALGTLFPALLAALLFCNKRRPALSTGLRLALTASFFLLPLLTLKHRNFKYVLIVSLAQWLIATEYLKRSDGARAITPAKVLSAVPLLFVMAMSWVAASRYIWWVSYEEFILGSNLSFVIFAVSLLLVLVNLYDPAPMQAGARSGAVRLTGDMLAVLLIAFACVRTDHIFGIGEMFHWSSFTGPAESVRQGGWLLWDVPSHYGFLSVLTLAWLPAKTTWQSLFVVNALFNFLIALMLFYLFRALRPGNLNLLFALAVTLAAVFFRSGLTAYYLGPNQLPNIGGLRFFWCFALCAILFWEYRWSGARAATDRRALWAGSVVWLVGTLWSVESAVYCSAVWLPAFALLVWQRALKSEEAGASFTRRLRASYKWLLLPPALLVGAILLITAFYLLRLGHAPDWRSFVEYARAYSGGFKALPMNAAGEVWVLVIVFCAFLTTAVYLLREGARSAALPLIVGVGCGLWATSSYFISRSHPNNLHNLAAIFCGVIGLTLYLLGREKREGAPADSLVRACLAPVLVAVLVSVFCYRGALAEYIQTPQASYLRTEQLVPIVDPSLDELLNSAGVKPDDPLVFIGQDEIHILSAWTYTQGERPEVLTTYRSWLPIPLYSFAPLGGERRETYVSRFGARTRAGGWLIEYKNQEPVFPWFSDFLRLHYTQGKTIENAAWRLTWYEYSG